MAPNESVTAFQEFAAGKGIDLNRSTSRQGMEAMLDFRTTVPCGACSDDMLLYQWGSYDWGEGEYFELNITRQFTEAELEDEDGISQLSLTYRYQPSAQLESLGAGNCWEDESPGFRQFVLASDPFLAVADATPDHIELSHFYV